MGISRQFRRLSCVLASKSDFLSFLRNHRRSRESSFLYPAHPAKPPSCTTILVAESQDLKPQMQTILSGRAVMATSIFDYFLRNQPRCDAQPGERGVGGHRSPPPAWFLLTSRGVTGPTTITTPPL